MHHDIPTLQELAAVAVGFRQRFPHHWPNAQQQPPLE